MIIFLEGDSLDKLYEAKMLGGKRLNFLATMQL